MSFKIVCALTNNNGSNGEQNEGVSHKESLDVILCDVLHTLLGPERARLDPILDLLQPAPALRWGFPVALGHGSCRPVGAGSLELRWRVLIKTQLSPANALSLYPFFSSVKLWNEPLNEETIKNNTFLFCVYLLSK